MVNYWFSMMMALPCREVKVWQNNAMVLMCRPLVNTVVVGLDSIK